MQLTLKAFRLKRDDTLIEKKFDETFYKMTFYID